MKLKKILFFVLVLLFSSISYCQEKPKIIQSKNARLIKALNNAELISENQENWLSLKVYKIDNGTGSAGFPSSEVSHNLLIAVSEFDENPEQNLFEIGPLLNPTFLNWKEGKEYEKKFEIEYGIKEERKRISMKVTINELTIEE